MYRTPCGIFLSLILIATASHVQAQPTPTAPDTTQPPLVSEVRFEGNELFSDEVLSLRVRTTANRRFLGVPGFTWWLWLYRAGSSGALGRRLGNALMASGEAPAYLDASVLNADVERIRLFYLQEGFRDARVSAVVDTFRNNRLVRVTFRIDQGQPTFIRQVTYDGLDALTPDQRFRLMRESLLRPESVDTSGTPGFRLSGRRYSETDLLEERRRLLSFLRDEGFASVTRDSIRAIVHPIRPDSFDIVFRIRPGERFRFGDVQFVVEGPDRDAPPYSDTLMVVPGNGSSEGGVVTSRVRNEATLEGSLLRRALRFSPGEWYDQSQLLATKRRLDATGVFAFTDILPLAGDTLRTFDTAPRLSHRVDLRTRRRRQMRFETFMLQRSGVLSGSDSELGTGVGVTYENLNLLGGGESFQVRATGSIAADGLSDSTLAAQAEVSTSITYPYLIAPFRGLDRLLGLYDARTRVSLSLLTARRDELKLIIRGRGVARLRIEMAHSPTVASLVDVLDVSLSNPDTLAGFRSAFLDHILGRGDSLIVEDPVQRAQIIEDYTQPQVNSALRYTFRSARFNPLRREQGYSYEGSFEIGSNLPYLLDRFVFTPDSLEGSLPGLPVFAGDRAGNRLAYRQYVRFLADLRRYRRSSRGTVLAMKFIGGIAHPTGNADVVPFDRRFYSGGATSVRGWGLRELGPGKSDLMARTDSTSGYTTNILGGDIKLEVGVEARRVLLHNLFAADWLGVTFLDAGNVWTGPRNPGVPEGRFRFGSFYREFGAGTGFGLRASWEYLILRLDFAYKLYDPARSGKGPFPDGLRRPIVHFGIGHAF